MTHRFNHDEMLQLTAARHRLILEIRNSVVPDVQAPLAIEDFERILNLVLPLGAIDYAGRDPDNLKRAK